MPEKTPADRALAASTAALALALGCLVLLLPPLIDHTSASVVRLVVVALALACTIALHWIFLGFAARRLERSVAGWVALAVLLFPIGGVIALVLLSWLGDEAARAAAHRA